MKHAVDTLLFVVLLLLIVSDCSVGVTDVDTTTTATTQSCDKEMNLPLGSMIDVVQNTKLQFIFVGGKGGVGKTTVSSALAIQVATRRHAASEGDVLLISTDPAHSLSDAFKIQFDGKPQKVPGVPGLYVMEIDPHIMLKNEVDQWAKLAFEAGLDLMGEVNKFQNWLTSIPGIDEATALSTVVDYVQTGKFSSIVFDTAPTGHTLKLLQLPDALQAGISQLQGWQTKLWSYYETFTNMMSFGKQNQKKDTSKLRAKLETKLQKYKDDIEKVALMLKDNKRTTFITVCIAEYLSISETQRLLQELHEHKIHTSHVVVNQLVTNGPSEEELNQLDTILSGNAADPQFIHKIKTSLKLVTAREQIQKKYLRMLSESDEAMCMDVVEVPLLPSEVTGVDNLRDFSYILVRDNVQDDNIKEEL